MSDKSKRDMERVYYDLDLNETPLKLTNRIVEAVARLPENVYDFIVERIQFESATNQMILSISVKKPYLIFLLYNACTFTILHEIAHVFLGHKRDTAYSENPNQENDADKLARKWLKS